MASAICDVASSSRARAAPFAPDGWPAWFLSVETRSGRVLWSAGKSPKSRPVANVRPIANRMTVPLMLKVIVCCTSGGSSEMTSTSVQCATTMPAIPPRTASS